MYPLQETLSSNIAHLTTPTHGEPSLGGSSVVTLSNGTMLYLSMCDVTHDPSPLGAFVSVFSGVNFTDVTPVWSSSLSLINATCSRAWLPFNANSSDIFIEREVIMVVGGTVLNTSAEAAHLVVSIWDPMTLEWYFDIDLAGHHRVPLQGTWALHPMVTTASNMMVLIGGGIQLPGDGNWSNAVLCRLLFGTGITLYQRNLSSPLLTIEAVVYLLPELPEPLMFVAPSIYVNTYTMTLYQDSVFVGVVVQGHPGMVGRLELSELSLPLLNVSGNEWMTVTLDGDVFQLIGATSMFVPLPHEGTVLALYAVGGIPVEGARPASISYMVVDESFVPAWVQVPYQPASGVLTFAVDTESSTINVSATFELIAAGASGL
ncbi:Hypothetical protein, putative, partial [Bodo saltans]